MSLKLQWLRLYIEKERAMCAVGLMLSNVVHPDSCAKKA